MKIEGEKTFWGRDVEDDLSDKAKVLLGVSVDAVVALLALPSPMLALSVFRSCRCLL